MENSHEESLLSAVEGFSPQPSPTPADFSDSDGDEWEEEEPRGSGVRTYMFELLSTAERERAHPRNMWSCAMVDNWQQLYDGGRRGRGGVFEKEFYRKQN